jgi:small conductance mechanosensitive channel
MEHLAREFATDARYLGLRLLAGALIFVAFWIGAKIALGVSRRIANRSESARQDAVTIIGQAARVALISFGALTALGTLGVNVTALVAGLGLTGFALGFAFRDVLSNLLAGLFLLIHRPFARHDHIAVTGFEGVVTGVDLRYTTLQREDGRILIPNSILFTNPITLRQRTGE